MMIDIEKVIAEAKDISARWHSQNGLTVGPGKAWVDYVDDLLAAIEQSQKRVAELEKALVRYGNHGGGCAAAYPVGVEAPCSCGYEEALSQDKKEQPDG